MFIQSYFLKLGAACIMIRRCCTTTEAKDVLGGPSQLWDGRLVERLKVTHASVSPYIRGLLRPHCAILCWEMSFSLMRLVNLFQPVVEKRMLQITIKLPWQFFFWRGVFKADSSSYALGWWWPPNPRYFASGSVWGIFRFRRRLCGKFLLLTFHWSSHWGSPLCSGMVVLSAEGFLMMKARPQDEKLIQFCIIHMKYIWYRWYMN